MVDFAANDGKSITRKELRGGEKAVVEAMIAVIDKLRTCDLLHRGGPEYRGEDGYTSLTICGVMLLSGFSEDRDVPKAKLQTWEQMDAKTLELYDIGRAVAWDVHNRVRDDLFRLLETEGFQQIRDLGAVLRV